ncbi:MAG: adenylyltransferase/cytidyltransferase family protein [Patescibacteria group bacterium]
MKSEGNSQLVKNILNGSLRFKDRYIPDHDILVSVVKILKDSGYRIVLTQGVYDLFHVGHKRYLENAKSHGDILIIGVDTDELTRSIKGPNRPFDKLDDRLEILTSLRTVDIVTTRGLDEHEYALIKLIKPDVLVMSQTTTTFTEKDKRNLIKYCGSIEVLPAQSSTSTTAKLRKMMVSGAEQLSNKISNIIKEFLIDIKNESPSRILPSHSRRSSGTLPKAKTRQAVHTRQKSDK